MEHVTAETMGIKRWEDITAEHLGEYRVLAGWSYYGYAEILGVNRGYVWAICRGSYPMTDRMRKRLWTALQNPVEAVPYYLREIAIRAAPRSFERYARTLSVPWERIRGGHLLECHGCGVKFVAFRASTKYHSRNCGKRYRRRIKRQEEVNVNVTSS